MKGAAVLSVRRLREAFYKRKADPARQRARLVKMILYAIGRIRGLPDCRDPQCAMATMTALADVDAQPGEVLRGLLAPAVDRRVPDLRRRTHDVERDRTRADVITVILGGGRGNRLDPLTRQRAKPAVPIAGKYRLIDIPISNGIHSGMERMFVLTQFNSVSLAPAHRAHVQVRPVLARLRADPGGAADAARRGVVPGDGRRGAAEPRDHPASRAATSC